MERPNLQKAGLQCDPDEWKTADEPATREQLSYLETLVLAAGEERPAGELTKAEASKLIDWLQNRSPRLAGDDREVTRQGNSAIQTRTHQRS
jgi:hypothetical protein